MTKSDGSTCSAKTIRRPSEAAASRSRRDPLRLVRRRLRLRLPEDLAPEARKQALAYLRLIVSLPAPGQRVVMPDGRIGTAVEIIRHSCYGLEPPDFGWRVVVRPEGGRAYEDRALRPSTLRPVPQKKNASTTAAER